MVAVAEITIIVVVVGWFLVPNITTIMELARSYAASKCKQLRGAKKNLQKLATDLEAIKGFLKPLSMGFVNDQTWLDSLSRLKEVIHDAEEILNLFETHIFEVEAAKNLKKHRDGASSSRKSTDFSCTSISKCPSLDQLEVVLEEVHKILEELRKRAPDHVLCPFQREDMGQDPVRERNLFFGYINEYKQLVTMLQDSNTDKMVIAIIGHGGMGKTELARQAFRDVENEFDLLIWVPAYGRHTQFDLLAEIWKSAVSKKSVGEMNISVLQKKLKKVLTSKKCLLVLDDVWSDEQAINESQKKSVLRCFTNFVSVGSRIVITTRAKICSTTFSADATIVLNGIGHTEVSLLLNDTAKLYSPIQPLLNKQLPKLKGSPLAAIEIGEELTMQMELAGSHRRCCNILNDIENHMGSVFSGHVFTYQHLPPHLQRCFSFCSIFPSSWRFQAEKLIRMWIAHGYVEEDTQHHLPASGKRSMEDIGRGYFDSLVGRSLFQKEAKAKGDKQTYYVIHEHIHWMLRRVSAQNCISISAETGHSAGPSNASIPATVRHLSVTIGCLDQLKAYPTRLSNLRTLLVLKDDGGNGPALRTPLFSAIGKVILELFKGVRVLDLTETGITQLPENIGKLKHVRYLGLPSTISSNLCDEVTRLLFLQTLSVGDKRDTEKERVCIANISGIGRLVKLRESIEFHVIRASEKEGHSVSELAGMNSLIGTLSIKGLDAVASKKEAEEACLANKVDINVLKLEWEPPAPVDSTGDPAAANLALAVLKGLKPPSCLQVLRITRYHGKTSPTWLSELKTLTCLYIRNCRNLQTLPAVGGLPCLELLSMKELNSVNRIGSSFWGGGVFPNLKQIVLEDMPKLVEWDKMPRQALPKLTKVRIVDCPCLSSLSGLQYIVGLDLRIERCKGITEVNLPANFSNGGGSTYKFE